MQVHPEHWGAEGLLELVSSTFGPFHALSQLQKNNLKFCCPFCYTSPFHRACKTILLDLLPSMLR